MKIIPDIQEVYQEKLPADTVGMRESYAREQHTESRIEKMKLEGWKKGYNLTFRSRTEDYDILFPAPQFTKKENIPTLKMSQLTKLEIKKDETI